MGPIDIAVEMYADNSLEVIVRDGVSISLLTPYTLRILEIKWGDF